MYISIYSSMLQHTFMLILHRDLYIIIIIINKLLKREATSYDSYIWSSSRPIYMIYSSNASSRCVDEPSIEKSIKN